MRWAVAVMAVAALLGRELLVRVALPRALIASRVGGARVVDGPSLVREGVTLSASLGEPDGTPRGTLVFAHGLWASRGQLGALDARARARGWRTLGVDLRGHGGSGGGISYGVLDGADLVAWLDRLEADGRLARPVVAVGLSYGGAAVLQLAARDPRVEAVATIATFTHLRGVAPRYVRRVLKTSGWWLGDGEIQRAITRAGELGGFDADAADSRAAIARTSARLLVVHGTDDRDIPPDHARALADAGDARIWWIRGGTHVSVFQGETGERVFAGVLDFLEER